MLFKARKGLTSRLKPALTILRNHGYFDDVITKFMINTRTDTWKTDVNLFILGNSWTKRKPRKVKNCSKRYDKKRKGDFKNRNVLESNASRKRGMFSDDAANVFLSWLESIWLIFKLSKTLKNAFLTVLGQLTIVKDLF